MNHKELVRQWVEADAELKELNARVKGLREKCAELKTALAALPSQQTYPLKVVSTNVAEPLTFKYLERTLGEIVKNPEQVQLIIEHVKKQRSIKVSTDVKILR